MTRDCMTMQFLLVCTGRTERLCGIFCLTLPKPHMTNQHIKEGRHAISYVSPCIPGPSGLHAEGAVESLSSSLDADAED